MFKLVICDDEGKTTIVPLIRDEITIGRKEGNTIRLTDRNVSRSHARLVREEEEVFSVYDLSSRNGTKINGDPLGGGGSAKIAPGDQIYIGDYNLSIRTDVSDGVPMGRQMDPGDGAGIGKVTSHARLVMLEGPEVGKEFDLTVSLYVIGRAEESNLHINDPSISRAHARLDGDEHQWTISDLDSINGIFVNGAKRDDYLLKSGDVIELGTVRLRFVPPGEPYDYAPPSDDRIAAPGASGGPNKLFIILGAVAALAVAAILVAILTAGGDGGEQEVRNESSSGDGEDTKALIEQGKDQMQHEEWDEAARLFAEAMRIDPTNEAARSLKRTALSEMEAQAAMVAALSAQESKSWQKAVEELSKISRSSYYYDKDLVDKMSALRCEELLVKARFIAKSGSMEDLEAVLTEIGELPQAPSECLDERATIKQLRLDREAAEGPRPAKTPSDQAPIDSNPYGPAPTPAKKAGGKNTGGAPVNPYDDGAGQVLDSESPPEPKGPKKITW